MAVVIQSTAIIHRERSERPVCRGPGSLLPGMFRVSLYTVTIYRNGQPCGRFSNRLWNDADHIANYWRDRRYTAVIQRV